MFRKSRWPRRVFIGLRPICVGTRIMGRMPMPREEKRKARDRSGEAAERSEGKPAVATPRGAFIS